MLTAIIDYSSGNLHSAQKAFEKITASNNLGSVVVTSDPKIISSADRLVLPGSTSRSAEEMIFGSLVTTTEPKLFEAVIFSNAFCAE